MGIHSSLRDLESLPASFIEYQPNLPCEQVEKLRAGWKHAVSQVLS
jgi:hypothetical protein